MEKVNNVDFFFRLLQPVSSKLVNAVNLMGKWCYMSIGGHMIKMATMTINDKNPSKIFFSGTSRLIALKLGMWHWGLGAHHNLFK